MRRRTIGGLLGGGLALLLALAPAAEARKTAKFKLLSLSGSTTMVRDVVYEPSPYGDFCSFSQRERVSFHSTKRPTAFAFTSKSHGRKRVEWWTSPNFPGNLTQIEVPAEVTVSRSATYDQSAIFDPESGETSYGCYDQVHLDGSPATDCAVERTVPATLRVGGTSDARQSTYVLVDLSRGALDALDAECEIRYASAAEDPRLFPRAALFDKRKRQVSDTNRIESPAFDHPSDDQTVTGTQVSELSGKLKRKRRR